ncbi:MAG: hypothetical protein ACYTKD_01735 [Planctomycetota bacterium]|jgi:hypothetical protein
MAVSTGRTRPSGRSGNTERFRALFRRHAFDLLRRGYERLDSAEYQASEEPVITGELRDAIRHVLDDRASPPPRWASSFFVGEEVHLSSADRKGKHRKIIDLQIEFASSHGRVRFDIEAKRLSQGNSGVADYLGSEGLGEFIAGNYANGDPDGGMLGYVQTGTPKEWAVKIEKCMAKRSSTLHVSTGGGWQATNLASDPKDCYRSTHDRPSAGRPISILHLLLDFTN